jgi:hypothetical protein
MDRKCIETVMKKGGGDVLTLRSLKKGNKKKGDSESSIG